MINPIFTNSDGWNVIPPGKASHARAFTPMEPSIFMPKNNVHNIKNTDIIPIIFENFTRIL